MTDTNTTYPGGFGVTSQPKDCYFINMLPREIRIKIYRILFRRPVGIVPCSSYGDQIGNLAPCWATADRWGYKWGGEDLYFSSFLKGQGPGIIVINKNPPKHWEDHEEFNGHMVYPLEGVALLSTYWQFHEEGSEKARSRIPGQLDSLGTPQRPRETIQNIQRIFTDEVHDRDFLIRDSMIRIFNKISIFKTHLLKRIRLEGELKTVERYFTSPRSDYLHMGFGSILRILTVILKHACPTLRYLTLVTTDVHGHLRHPNSYWSWDDEDPRKRRVSDEDKIDEIVAMVAKGLPSLTRLNLHPFERAIYIDYIKKETKLIRDKAHPLNWGKSEQWVKFVSQREPMLDDSLVKAILESKNSVPPLKGKAKLKARLEREKASKPAKGKGKPRK